MKTQVRIATSWTGFSFTTAIARPHFRFWCFLFGTLVGFAQAGAQTPNFVLSCSPPAGPAYYVAVADVNGDGKPDLICVDNLEETVLVILTNNGSGGFGFNAELPLGSGPCRSVAVADVNGDGKPDLICANGSTLTVLTNNGTGGLGSSATLNVGGSATYVTVADVNGDGKVDLVSANRAGTLTVLTNNGSGAFGSNATLSAGTGFPVLGAVSVYSIAAADVNGDGKPDLIIANEAGVGGLPPPAGIGLMVFTNNGSGGFGPNPSQSFGPASISVAVADVNGDGQPDLISADSGSDPNGHTPNGNTLRVWTNNGSGVFATNATLTVDGYIYYVTVADVNGDGKPDLICANSPNVSSTPGDLTVFTNNGSGAFGLYATLAVGSNPRCVVAADVNGDGRLDLISANSYDNNLSVLFNVPCLDIGLATNSINLVWPFPSSDYVLQQNSDLGTSHWVNVTNTANIIGGLNQTTVSSPAGIEFFRLSHLQ